MKYYEDLVTFNRLIKKGKLDSVGYRAYSDLLQNYNITCDKGNLISDYINYAVINDCSLIKHFTINGFMLILHAQQECFLFTDNTMCRIEALACMDFNIIYAALPITLDDWFFRNLKPKEIREQFGLSKVSYPYKNIETQLINYCERKIKSYDGNPN